MRWAPKESLLFITISNHQLPSQHLLLLFDSPLSPSVIGERKITTALFKLCQDGDSIIVIFGLQIIPKQKMTSVISGFQQRTNMKKQKFNPPAFRVLSYYFF